jgi:hypothetical protein
MYISIDFFDTNISYHLFIEFATDLRLKMKKRGKIIAFYKK